VTTAATEPGDDGEGGDRAAPAPLVSVIIPTWNRAPMLRLTLQTVLAQDLAGGDFEVLVIGDACTDDSEAAVASFRDPRLHWHNLPANSGSASRPNNTGLRLARGRYIAHLGHDDFWFPWHLSGLVTTIETTGADWVYSLVVAIGPDGIRHCTGPPQAGVPDAEHHVPPSGWLYRREIVADVGWWADPETIPWQIDFDVMRRAALAGKRFACHRRPSAMKFPSSLFPDGYRTGEPAPIQRTYFERLRHAPDTLEREILIELAVRFAQLDRGGGKGVFGRNRASVQTSAAPWSTLFRWLVAVYGADRWPMRQLLRQDFQERRLGRQHLRGLAAGLVAPSPIEGEPAIPVSSPRAMRAGQPRRNSQSPGAASVRMLSREERRERRRQRAERVATEAAAAASELETVSE
jgi:glycosyltransferase involved in cell wall biosynthesis